MSASRECPICLEPHNDVILLPCGHSDACLRCVMTMSVCYGLRTCPICQKEMTGDPIIADTIAPASYEEEVTKPYQHDAEMKIYYAGQADFERLRAFGKFHCKVCGREFGTFKQFANHVSGAHKLRACKLCDTGHCALPSETETFRPDQYKKHLSHHPMCVVCPFRGVDQKELAEHMRKDHFRCEVCAQEGKVVWFASADLIRVHFHEEHFACEDPMCVEQGFIVFATRMELQLHMINVHNDHRQVHVETTRGGDEDATGAVARSEREARASVARRTLSSAIRREVRSQKDAVSGIFALIDRLEHGKVAPGVFLRKVQHICREKTDILFCAVAAAIRNPDIRATVVRERIGLRPCAIPAQPQQRMSLAQDFPKLADQTEDVPTEPQPQPLPPTTGRRRKRPKCVVLMSI